MDAWWNDVTCVKPPTQSPAEKRRKEEAGYLNRESSIRPAKLELIKVVKLISALSVLSRSAGHFEALTNYTPQTPNLQEWTIRLIVIMRSRDWLLLLTARLKNLTKKQS
ncbi:hypothetical protein DTO271D3_7142 [Paecilomyces variotii]|nr:hypothetical protein DTO212C5_1231 [Paecilomyces variotii]KAJ9312595.1 hypothetical protein DTO271D3_7142 [Paecilomyces variotii]KAJ9360598.1 hypothetical protein DTO280E4_4315 [Paecilomyces variotii]